MTLSTAIFYSTAEKPKNTLQHVSSKSNSNTAVQYIIFFNELEGFLLPY